MESVLEATNSLAEQLQESGMVLSRAYSLIKAKKKSLVLLRTDLSLAALYNATQAFGEDSGIMFDAAVCPNGQMYIRTKRIQQISVKLKDFFGNCTIGKKNVTDSSEPISFHDRMRVRSYEIVDQSAELADVLWTVLIF